MNIKKILGAVGAAAAAFGGLVLAGKSGFGENLFTKKEDPVEYDDEFDGEVEAYAADDEEVVLEEAPEEES